jgi:hypothetical protein
MGHGTLSQGFPHIHSHDGSHHPANKHVDHELNTEHQMLMHVHGPEQDTGEINRAPKSNKERMMKNHRK